MVPCMVCVLCLGEGIASLTSQQEHLSGREASMPTYLHLRQPPQSPWSLLFLPAPTSPVGSDSHMYLIFRNKVNIPMAVTK